MRSVFSALILSAAMALPAAADDGGVLNPEEGGITNLRADLAARPERAGFLCWVVYETQKGGMHDMALDALEDCASSGNAPSMIMLAHALENGLGTEPDPELATYWVRQAAEQGYAVGQYHYGMALLRGYGVAKNEEEALTWLRRAADNGDTSARDVLKTM